MPDASDDFEKFTLPLPAGHNWQCKPGNNLFVADRGAVAFEIPAKWVIRHDKKQTLMIHDQPPPADQARLSLTVFHLPPVKGGWGQVSLQKLLAQVVDRPRHGKKPPIPLEIHTEERPYLELVWTETAPWTDPANGRKIRCRQMLARAQLVKCLITFDVYQDKAADFQQVWEDLLATIQLAVPRDITGQVGN